MPRPLRTDFDGDGADDFVTGDPFADVDGLPGAGAVHLVSGRALTPVGAPDPAAGDAFGWSVALAQLDGDGCADLLVGAPYADVDGRTDAGAVYVLYGGAERNVRIVAPEPQQDAHFGWSLAASPDDGGVVAIGAPYEEDDQVRDAGAVYLFRGNDTSTLTRISQESEGVTGNSETGDMFGWSLALGRLAGAADGVDLAVGSPYENNDGTGRQNVEGMLDTGGLNVVHDPTRAEGGRYTGGKWELKDLVDTSVAGEAPGDRFGYALAYAAGSLAVSAPLADVRGVKDAGLVHVLRSDGFRALAKGTTLYQDAEGVEGDAAATDAFGFSLAMGAGETPDDVRLAVGIPFDAPEQKGAVQLIPLANPGEDRLLTSASATPNEHFGWSVAFSGNRLLAGIPDAPKGGAVGVLGRVEGAFTLLTPTPAGAGGTTTDTGVSLSG
ncbi:FG-GAP repeat protein [Thermocatellispora tengchongensis]|uniref:FG-GAP repeat protein n=1 Tax=Thermocatellispora tengchongensis TaxID=1073253 RepID=UPI0036370EDB